jgi:hypothetical protein
VDLGSRGDNGLGDERHGSPSLTKDKRQSYPSFASLGFSKGRLPLLSHRDEWPDSAGCL